MTQYQFCTAESLAVYHNAALSEAGPPAMCKYITCFLGARFSCICAKESKFDIVAQIANKDTTVSVSVKHSGGSFMVVGCISAIGVGDRDKTDGILNTEKCHEI